MHTGAGLATWHRFLQTYLKNMAGSLKMLPTQSQTSKQPGVISGNCA